ncbi:MAG: hypothetical protein ACOZNI_07915 [Myxococcota bacterium]
MSDAVDVPFAAEDAAYEERVRRWRERVKRKWRDREGLAIEHRYVVMHARYLSIVG